MARRTTGASVWASTSGSSVVVKSWRDDTGGKGNVGEWMAAQLQKGLRVTPSRESYIINVAFQGSDPAFVTAVANAYVQAFIEAAVEMKVEPAREYARWFADQAKVLREGVEKAQARLSAFQQAKGIVATVDAVDNELAKLNELSARLTAAQGDTRDAQSKQRTSASVAAGTLPEVLGNVVVQGLRTQISDREARLKEAANNLGTRHPQYMRMESELAELKNRLEIETSHVASAYTATSAVGKSREAELQAAVEAQKRRVLKLRTERDEIAVLLRDVETAKRAYEGVTSRYNQISLEAQVTQTNVSVLNPAVEPHEPVFPKPRSQTLLMLLALGIVFGVAAAFGLEMLDRRVRSADDLAQMLQAPVLAVIESGRRPRRLARRSGAMALPSPR
jgi:chain length determinant protein EpsF